MNDSLTLETLIKLMKDIRKPQKPQPEVILFINIKDWLTARRELRKDRNIEIKRIGRTVTFKMFYRSSPMADICVGTKNQLPVPDGKFLQMPKPNPLANPIKVEFEPFELPSEIRWRGSSWWRF